MTVQITLGLLLLMISSIPMVHNLTNWMYKLKSAVTDGTILVAVHFSIFAEIPLRPETFHSSTFRRNVEPPQLYKEAHHGTEKACHV